MKKTGIFMLLLLCLFSACRPTVPVPTEPPLTEVPVVADHDPAADIQPDEANTEAAAAPAQPEIPPYNDYNVSLEIEPETRTVKGIERIRYTNRSDQVLEEIVVRLYLNAFAETTAVTPYFTEYESRIFIHGKDYGHMNILHVSLENDDLVYRQQGTVLTILLDEPLQPEQTVQIKIQFDAYVPKIAHRTGANDQAMWCGMFLPVLSIYDKDGWHTEPYYPAGDPFILETANYWVEISAPTGYEVAGTGVKQENTLEDKTVTVFTANMTRDFAFALSPAYKIAETVTNSNVDIQFYYYTEALDTESILNTAKSAVEYFEATIGAYPYGQVCIAETDMFVNGMEFSKILFIDSAYLKRNPPYTSLVHELGHQWFYNVVGSNPITEPWLDEGLTMFEQEGFFRDENELRTKLRDDYTGYKSVLPMKGDTSKWVIANGLSVYDNWPQYYQVNYVKAKLMVYALRNRIGVENYRQFISEYYKTYSFRMATAEDFIRKAEEISGEDLSDFFDEWLYGETLPDGATYLLK